MSSSSAGSLHAQFKMFLIWLMLDQVWILLQVSLLIYTKISSAPVLSNTHQLLGRCEGVIHPVHLFC